MTEPARYVAREDLSRALELLAAGRDIVAPRREGGAVAFRPWRSGEPLGTERSTASPKEVLFPQSETLFSYTRSKDPEDAGRSSLRLEPARPGQPTLLFGCRPCDARGMAALDQVFLEGPYRDPYYAARREATLVAALACEHPESTCFCHWTGGGPDGTAGSDLLFAACGDGYVVRAVTGRGETALAAAGLPEAGGRAQAAAETSAAARAALDAMSPAPDLAAAPALLRERFDDTGFWRGMSDACLSCGACASLCPTCHCFNITDENTGGDGLHGRRLRSWDTCMSPQFTREASGHNPRNDKALRLRNRVQHKYAYFPGVHGGMSACTGCGRCIARCPVSLDIRKILLAAIGQPQTKETSHA